jgi:phospholipase/lecithinase/hemolysin
VALVRKLLTILFLITSCANANAATFSHLYVVGDSFSDTGHGVQIGQLLSTSYYNQSEASNGPIWPEQLMAALGKPYNQGDNQAVSGAATYTYQTTFRSQLVTRPGLIDQINSFQLLGANRSVFAIWIGHNDLSLSPADSLNQAADSALATVKNGVALLRKKGATRILVLGLCDWAVTPAAHRTPDQQGVMNMAVLRFNTGLQQFARQMTRKFAGRATVRYVDTYDFLDGVRGQTANPDGIGTTDPQWICCRDWSAGNNYGYWDGVHYTTFIYDQLAQKLKAIINKMK